MTGTLSFGGYVSKVTFKGIPYTKYRRKLPDLTENLMDILQRPIQKTIEFLGGVVIGKPGYGKTELVRFLVSNLLDYYGEDQVNAVTLKGRDIMPLLDAMDSKPVQILLLDDCVGDIGITIQEQFDLIRHRYNDVLRAKGIEKRGIIMVFFTVQTLFSIDKEYRRNSDFMIIKSHSIDDKYNTLLKPYAGKTGLQKLSEIELRVKEKHDHSAKGISVIKLSTRENTPGIIKTELTDREVFTVVESLEVEEEPDDTDERTEIYHDEDIGDEIPVEWEKVRTIQDRSFLDLVYTFVPDALEDQSTKYYKPKHADAWKLRYAQGMTTDHLADEFNVSKSVFTNSYKQGGWISIFNKEVAGYAAEYALQHRYYPDCKVYGKNNPAEPDLYNPETGLMVEVKLRHRKEAPNMSMFSNKERKNIQKGKPTHLAIITYKPGKCLINIYQPSLLSNPTNPASLGAAPEAAADTETQRRTPENPVETRPHQRPTRKERVMNIRGKREGDWADGLNPLAVDKAGQVLELALKSAGKTAEELGIPLRDAVPPTLETAIERLEAIKEQAVKPPEYMDDVITYVKRYREAQIQEKTQ